MACLVLWSRRGSRWSGAATTSSRRYIRSRRHGLQQRTRRRLRWPVQLTRQRILLARTYACEYCVSLPLLVSKLTLFLSRQLSLVQKQNGHSQKMRTPKFWVEKSGHLHTAKLMPTQNVHSRFFLMLEFWSQRCAFSVGESGSLFFLSHPNFSNFLMLLSAQKVRIVLQWRLLLLYVHSGFCSPGTTKAVTVEEGNGTAAPRVEAGEEAVTHWWTVRRPPDREDQADPACYNKAQCSWSTVWTWTK